MTNGILQGGACFVLMPFADEFDATFDAIKRAAGACGLNCTRADEVSEPGPVADQVYAGIDNAVICIADLTGGNPNVFVEFGYAQARKKPVILIYRGQPERLPFDVRHLRVIAYTAAEEGHRCLTDALIRSLRATLGSPKQVLKEMLVPASLRPQEGPQERFVVAASPLSYREAVRLGGGFKKLRRTSADHVGIRGLIQGFGLIYGLDRLPDLVNPGDYIDDAVKKEGHIYCIGSPKANRWTGVLLDEFFDRWKPRLDFKADPSSKDLRNVWVMVEKDGVQYLPPGFTAGNRRSRDFGFVIRGPHPFEPRYMFMILAGRSALGTHAACLAATVPKHVTRIKALVAEQAKKRGLSFDINDHHQAFWAAAHMRAREKEQQYEPIPDSLEIPWAEPFDLRSQS